MLVLKKSTDPNKKKYRLCVDFRQLNKKLIKDRFPIPRIEEILDRLGGTRYFSTLDMSQSFLQIPLGENSRDFTSFTVDSGTYRYTRLPFGLSVSSNSFQYMMFQVMSVIPKPISRSYQENLDNIRIVFKALRDHNLKLNREKCKFLLKQVTYLGHLITYKGILPDPDKARSVLKYPIPRNADEVRRFTAFCNYYRRHIQNCKIFVVRGLPEIL